MLHCIYFATQLYIKKVNLRINIHPFIPTNNMENVRNSSSNSHATVFYQNYDCTSVRPLVFLSR